MTSLHAQIMARRLGRVAVPPNFVRRIDFAALIPSPTSGLVLLGFSADGESILGYDRGSPWLLAWPTRLNSDAGPLRATDGARVLPRPAPCDEGDRPARLCFVEAAEACALFSETFADGEGGSEWRCAVGARPRRSRGGVAYAGAAQFSFTQCRGAEAPGAGALRDAGPGAALLVLHRGDSLTFLAFKKASGDGGGAEARDAAPAKARFAVDARWWGTRKALDVAVSDGGTCAQTSFDVEAFLAAATPRFRTGAWALVDYRVVVAPARHGIDAPGTVCAALAWRSRPSERRLAAPSSRDVVTAAVLRASAATGAVAVEALVDVASTAQPLEAAAAALLARGPRSDRARPPHALDNAAAVAGEPLRFLANPAYPVAIVLSG